MKNLYSNLFILALLAVLISCKEDEEKIDPIVGTWILDDAIYSDAPVGYSYSNRTYQSMYGESEYSIRFYDDMTFERELEDLIFQDGSGVEDEGTYELDEEYLMLEPEESVGLSTDFKLVDPVTERDLVLSTSATIGALSDAVIDTITSQESYNTVFAEHAQSITLNIMMNFDKE
ncbi:hypothetical protein [Reichenbachiella agariperforans]|uniref:hypothetical protein n=1 Tax=Reichenbachiella agariperforans TaxID=156994 RepID=UPI001C0861BB|nr:hypothetical protein [Reichenbachiella agariperforans]MBU2913494.1 hypothetical protein [Reichenbachiella agariperforans]